MIEHHDGREMRLQELCPQVANQWASTAQPQLTDD